MLLLRGTTYYLRRRVPLRYKEVEDREQMLMSLHTDSETTAKTKASAVWAELIEGWEAKLEGVVAIGAARLAAAKKLAARRGFSYLPVEQVAKLPPHDLLERVEAAVSPTGKLDMKMAEAALGGVIVKPMPVSAALEEYWRSERAKLIGKSEDQIRRARNPRMKAIRNFIDIVGDKPYLEVTTPDLYEFRAWWVEKMMRGEVTANTVNKDLVYLTSTLRAVATSQGQRDALRIDTKGLNLDEGEKRTRPPFSTGWITDKILAPRALKGLNSEARCIILGMVNTGYRPSEGAMLTGAQIRLDANIPHISIEGVNRTLKTPNAKRLIPLLGVSLDAFRESPNGFPRYADAPHLSDTVNKFLRENGLLETKKHSFYSLRHAFEDRMLAAGIDERIRRDLMGHALNRERYGHGASLELQHELMRPVSL